LTGDRKIYFELEKNQRVYDKQFRSMQSEKGVINYEDNTHDPDDLMFQTEIDVSTKKSKI